MPTRGRRWRRGNGGNWLLDPFDVEVVEGGDGVLDDVDMFADAPSSGVTTIGADLISGAVANVTLQATHDITFSSGIDIAAANVGLTALAGNDIRLNNRITTNGGGIVLAANAPGGFASGTGVLSMEGPLATNGGNVDLSATSIVVASISSRAVPLPLLSGAISLVGELMRQWRRHLDCG